MPKPEKCPLTGVAPRNREQVLAYNIVEHLDRANLNPRTSPAVQLWAAVEFEILKWMQAEGIETNELPRR